MSAGQLTLLEQYQTTSSPDIQPVLNAIVNAPAFTFDAESRTQLIGLLLKDLKSSKGRISSKDNGLALLALKNLGKNPTGSELLGNATNLTVLLDIATSLKDDPDASCEALRCIANAMLLIERARIAFVSKEVNGGDICVNLLQKATNADQIFILARILFLSTVHASPFIVSLVEDKRHGHTVVDVVSGKLDLLVISLLSGTKMAREAMVDVLKFAFNILMHYPKLVDPTEGLKVIGDAWSSKLDPILPSLLRVFHALPPTFPAPIAPPLTHVIHTLITIPVNPALRSEWFGGTPASSGSSSPKAIPVVKARRNASSGSSRTQSPVRSNGSGVAGSPKPSTLDRALSVLSAGRLSRSPSPIPPSKGPQDTLVRAHDLLDIALSHYFPDATDADDISVREKVKAEGGSDSLDDGLSPLIVLITRLCQADENARTRTRDWLIPTDLDRSAAGGNLETRTDTLGRCLRLMSSVYHSRVKDSIGEMLFAICDSDASVMSALLGYGNVAGFLFNKGIMAAPPPPSGTSSAASAVEAASADNINPITGTAQAPRPPEPEMTQEEKEQEMEKLFVLFDRLERTGAIPPSQNPVRKAIEKAASGAVPESKPDDGDDD